MKGELNPMSAFMTGKLKVDGNVMLAQRLVSHVDRSSLADLG
jgi:putative sterol carrier protein